MPYVRTGKEHLPRTPLAIPGGSVLSFPPVAPLRRKTNDLHLQIHTFTGNLVNFTKGTLDARSRPGAPPADFPKRPDQSLP